MTIICGFVCFSLQLDQLVELFDREQITMEILAEMGHEDLKQVGVSAYGFRHKILKGMAAIRATTGISVFSIHFWCISQMVLFFSLIVRLGSNTESVYTFSRFASRR